MGAISRPGDMKSSLALSRLLCLLSHPHHLLFFKPVVAVGTPSSARALSSHCATTIQRARTDICALPCRVPNRKTAAEAVKDCS